MKLKELLEFYLLGQILDIPIVLRILQRSVHKRGALSLSKVEDKLVNAETNS